MAKKTRVGGGRALALFARFLAGAKWDSHRDTNSQRQTFLGLLIDAGFQFATRDWTKLYARPFDGTYWLGEEIERWYQRAVENGNLSACKAMETYLQRPALIYEDKRLYVGRVLLWQGADVTVTSFGEDTRGWYAGAVKYKYEPSKGPYGHRTKKVEKRFKLTIAEFKSQLPKKPPGQEPLLRDTLKYIFGGSWNKEAATYLTLEEWWQGETAEKGHHWAYWMFDLVKAVRYPIDFYEGKELEHAAPNKVREKIDFAKLKPLVKAKIAALKAEAKAKKKTARDVEDDADMDNTY